MGLDMYAYKVPKNPLNTTFHSEDEGTQIAYWRKFNALHGWMEQQAREAGLAQEFQFNCVRFQLEPHLLDELEKAIEENSLTPTAGFFFGSQTIHPDDVEDAKKFLVDAREALADGFDVYYDSWW